MTSLPCSVDECGAAVFKRGMCSKHYHLWRAHGDATIRVRSERGSLNLWLKANVDHDGDECLIWPFGRAGDGYGQTTVGGKRIRAHRQMCLLAHGAPPTKLHQAAHSCGKGHLGCVNPKHLRWATRAENEADKVVHGTATRGERNASASITEADVLSIRRMAREGRSRASIAREFGMLPQNVSRIVTRTTWRAVA